jgi:hypothetical protein
MQEFAEDSTEYVRVPVAAKEAGVVVNPTTSDVQMAFMASGSTPGGSDWKTADWEVDTTTTPSTYYARAQLSSFTIAAGNFYNVWITINDPSETVVRNTGAVHIY